MIKYIEYLRNTPSISNLEDAPGEVWKLYKDELLRLYALCVRKYFHYASDRKSYSKGVKLIRKLIKYGDKEEAIKIVEELKTGKPRRPALIEELSKLIL